MWRMILRKIIRQQQLMATTFVFQQLFTWLVVRQAWLLYFPERTKS